MQPITICLKLSCLQKSRVRFHFSHHPTSKNGIYSVFVESVTSVFLSSSIDLFINQFFLNMLAGYKADNFHVCKHILLKR